LSAAVLSVSAELADRTDHLSRKSLASKKGEIRSFGDFLRSARTTTAVEDGARRTEEGARDTQAAEDARFTVTEDGRDTLWGALTAETKVALLRAEETSAGKESAAYNH
jgi:hypothetical protein